VVAKVEAVVEDIPVVPLEYWQKVVEQETDARHQIEEYYAGVRVGDMVS